MDLQFVFLSLNESDIMARQLIGVVEKELRLLREAGTPPGKYSF